MTEVDTKPGMASGARHVYGPRHLAALMPAVTRAAFRRRSPATAHVMTEWPAIVGPALAGLTTPRSLSSGTLTIACAGPMAMELAHLADELCSRINAHLGRQTVTRLRFVQTVAPPPAPKRAPAPPPLAAARAASAVAGLPDGRLKDALAGLGALVLAGSPHGPPDEKPARRPASTSPSNRR